MADTAELELANVEPLANTITMTKLALLDGPVLNQVLSDILGRKVATYLPGDDILVTGMKLSGSESPWLRSIDSDHAWRSDGMPRFSNDSDDFCGRPGFQGTPRPVVLRGGTGLFPIWKSCALRPAFRNVFKDWENPTDPAGFPDWYDESAADPVNDPDPPTSELTEQGRSYVRPNGVDVFVAGDHVYRLNVHDTPADRSFPADQLGLEFRVYRDPSVPGPFVRATQNQVVPLDRGNGIYYIDYHAEDPCHTS